MSESHLLVQQHFRRNWLSFLGDYVGFGVGVVFASTTTTLPAFAAMLTDHKVLIGAVSSVWAGGWLLPQIFAANYLADKPRKFSIMMLGQIFGRPAFPLFVLWLVFGGARYPALTLVLFLLSIVIFMSTDALVALAYLDIFGKSMAPNARGRLIGVGQLVTGIASIGAGAIIRQLLGPRGAGFPMNFIVIFGLASLCFAFSTICCAFIVEAPEAVAERRPSLRDYLPQLARLWRTDRRFARLTLVRLCSGLGTLATSFYVVYATDVLNMPLSAIGVFAGATTIGAALAGLVLGVVADRRGSHRVVQIVVWAQFLVPVLALLLHAGLLRPAAAFLYPLLYVLLGIYDGSFMLGFLNYVLEIAPAGQRPTYIGLTNTLSGALIFMPILGGLVLEKTSYPVLFGLAAVGTLTAALMALRLPNPRGLRAAADASLAAKASAQSAE